jgi:hypothetical protein
VFTAYALVKNLDSQGNELQFRDSTLRKIQNGHRHELETARHIFPQVRVNFGDWIYEQSYREAPPVLDDEQDLGFGRIPLETEDKLLLLRLFKIGDIGFSGQSLRLPDGELLTQFPYWAMSDTNTTLRYAIQQNECDEWDVLALELPGYPAWRSVWFKTARRFFLSGAAKEFNLHWATVDRIVDFMVALEAVLSTDNDYLRRQLAERSAGILKLGDAKKDAALSLMKKFYDLRSSIAHGSQLSDKQKTYIRKNREAFELIVRNVLVASIRNLACDDVDRRDQLRQIFEVTDTDRSAKAVEIFLRIGNRKTRTQLLVRLLRSFW